MRPVRDRSGQNLGVKYTVDANAPVGPVPSVLLGRLAARTLISDRPPRGRPRQAARRARA